MHGNRQALIERATPLFVDHPAMHFTMQGLADAMGVSIWTARYHYGSIEGLLRAVTRALIAEVERLCVAWPAPTAQVHQNLAGNIDAVAVMLEGQPYRDLVHILLRNSRSYPWLEEIYERRIVGTVCERIEQGVIDSGQLGGTPVLMVEGVSRRIFKRLEAVLAVSSMLPARSGPTALDRQRLVRDAAREAFEATYIFDWQRQ